MNAPSQATAALVLGPELTVVHAEALRGTLLSRLAEAPPVDAVDLAGVTAMDTAGVQLLLSLKHSLARAGQPWQVGAASGVVLEVLAVYGLTAELQPSHGAFDDQ